MTHPILNFPSQPLRCGDTTRLSGVVELIAGLAPRRDLRRERLPKSSIGPVPWGEADGLGSTSGVTARCEGDAHYVSHKGLSGGARRGLKAALGAHGLLGLARFSAQELGQVCDLTPGHAQRVAAAFALGREVERARIGERPSLKKPSAVADYMAPLLRGLEVEAFYALYLDARHRLKERLLVGQGTLTSAPVHPREVFGPAVRLAAGAVIVVHNHPSGDPEPSAADREVTQRLVGAGGILGVPLLDHLIWADGAWTSLREVGDWPT